MEEAVKKIAETLSVPESVAKNLYNSGFKDVESFKGIEKADLQKIDQVGEVTAERIVSVVEKLFLEKEVEVLKEEKQKLLDDIKNIAEENVALKHEVKAATLVEEKPSCLGEYPFGKNVRACRVCKHHVRCKELSDKGSE